MPFLHTRLTYREIANRVYLSKNAVTPKCNPVKARADRADLPAHQSGELTCSPLIRAATARTADVLPRHLRAGAGPWPALGWGCSGRVLARGGPKPGRAAPVWFGGESLARYLTFGPVAARVAGRRAGTGLGVRVGEPGRAAGIHSTGGSVQ